MPERRAERIARDGGLVGCGKPRIVENALILRQQDVARLRKLPLQLLIEGVRGGAFLIGCLDGCCLCSTSHGDLLDVRGWREVGNQKSDVRKEFRVEGLAIQKADAPIAIALG